MQSNFTIGKYQRVDLPRNRKRNPKRMAIVLAIVLLLSCWVGVQLYNGRAYFVVIRINWDISLPTHATLRYENRTEAGIHGDGERYHVYQYSRTPDFAGLLTPSNGISAEDKGDVLMILSRSMAVDAANMPPFEQVTLKWKNRQKDSSRIYLYYVESTKQLFVIERFQ